MTVIIATPCQVYLREEGRGEEGKEERREGKRGGGGVEEDRGGERRRGERG